MISRSPAGETDSNSAHLKHLATTEQAACVAGRAIPALGDQRDTEVAHDFGVWTSDRPVPAQPSNELTSTTLWNCDSSSLCFCPRYRKILGFSSSVFKYPRAS
jgi:hypothetical protein